MLLDSRTAHQILGTPPGRALDDARREFGADTSQRPKTQTHRRIYALTLERGLRARSIDVGAHHAHAVTLGVGDQTLG